MCVIEIIFPNTKRRGKGYWKLNTQYLNHERYRKIIEEFWEDWKTKKSDFQDLQEWWDIGKVYIKSLSIDYAQDLYHTRNEEKRKLTLELAKCREGGNQEKEEEILSKLKKSEMEKCLSNTSTTHHHHFHCHDFWLSKLDSRTCAP